MIEWKSTLKKTRKHKDISVFPSSNIFALNIKLSISTNLSALLLTPFNNLNRINKIYDSKTHIVNLNKNSILFNHDIVNVA